MYLLFRKTTTTTKKWWKEEKHYKADIERRWWKFQENWMHKWKWGQNKYSFKKRKLP